MTPAEPLMPAYTALLWERVRSGDTPYGTLWTLRLRGQGTWDLKEPPYRRTMLRLL